MNDLDKTLMLKRPALVVRSRQASQLMTAPAHSRHRLLAEAHKQERRGVIALEQDAPSWNERARRWELRVIPIKVKAPAWRKRAIIGGIVLAVLIGLFALAWHAASTLSSGTLSVFLLAVLLALSALVARGHRSSVSVTTTTTVRVRR